MVYWIKMQRYLRPGLSPKVHMQKNRIKINLKDSATRLVRRRCAWLSSAETFYRSSVLSVLMYNSETGSIICTEGFVRCGQWIRK